MGCSSMAGSYPLLIDSSYVPLSKSDEKLNAEKYNTGGALAPALYIARAREAPERRQGTPLDPLACLNRWTIK